MTAHVMGRTEGLEAEFYRREGTKEKGFWYVAPDGEELEDAAQLERIAKLAVPPGYAEVWVAPDANSELQAFGRDAKGRLQYRYHADFVRGNQAAKWARLIRFGNALPTMRERTGADLRRPALSSPHVLALMTRLLYVARFRVGSAEYARVNKTYGLTTLRQRHVSVSGATVDFSFRGKHGVHQHKATADKAIAANVSKLLELPGPWLFQYETDDMRKRVTSDDLNRYIRDAMGEFSAKDFRTWGGTLLAAEFLAETGVAQSDRQARRTLIDCVKFVSEDLGNTPTVVRAHYVSPSVFDRYLEGKVLDDFEPRDLRVQTSSESGLSRSELALKRLLEKSVRQGRKKS